ncbi:hypothetical protein TSAR_013858 [Trichomalopsis sarcophagae]|uniref:Uncharacterized protein n=1 Tax=Trichomalopsis sarcophagae TaxID=543379 RepID=A0A232FIF3_9HYME|nr:hypothetical protein TSAR_013858 [Trichomalopsis sarcophagae]
MPIDYKFRKTVRCYESHSWERSLERSRDGDIFWCCRMLISEMMLFSSTIIGGEEVLRCDDILQAFSSGTYERIESVFRAAARRFPSLYTTQTTKHNEDVNGASTGMILKRTRRYSLEPVHKLAGISTLLLDNSENSHRLFFRRENSEKDTVEIRSRDKQQQPRIGLYFPIQTQAALARPINYVNLSGVHADVFIRVEKNGLLSRFH